MLYNPGLLHPDELIDRFIVRHGELEYLRERIPTSKESVQHLLVIGSRGMGKTTILLRLACEIEQNPALNRLWIPVCFDEEQYNIGGLADFWLNCFEVLAEQTKDTSLHKIADRLLANFREHEHSKDKTKKDGNKEGELEEAARRQLFDFALRHNRGLLLLVDNVDVILNRIDSDVETGRLREVLQHEPGLMLIGAASNPIEATYDYDKPFYELFQVVELKPLTRDETEQLLIGLGERHNHVQEVRDFVGKRQEIFDILHRIMGGNPRTITIFFEILRDDPDASLESLLNSLLDRHASAYKDRIESLSPLGQRVFDALVRRWNPATAEQIAEDLRTTRGVTSAQLHRLVERGMARKIKLPERAMGFQVAERFFNIWCLMRGRRRNRQRLHHLLEFMSIFYERRTVQQPFRRLLSDLTDLGFLDQKTAVKVRETMKEYAKKVSDPHLLLAPQNMIPQNDPRVEFLVHCGLTQPQEAHNVLEYMKHREDYNPVFSCLGESFLLEDQGKLDEALACIDNTNSLKSTAFLQLERSRLLVALARYPDAGTNLISLASSQEVQAAKLAAVAIELAKAGGDAAASMALTVITMVLQREPDNEDVLLASCEVELLMGRRDRALDQLRQLVARRKEESPRWDRAILEKLLEIAATGEAGAAGALALMEETDLATRWEPLVHALAHLSGRDEQRLETLAPEMREFTELVEKRISELRESVSTVMEA